MPPLVVLDSIRGFRLSNGDPDDALGACEVDGSRQSTGIDWLPWSAILTKVHQDVENVTQDNSEDPTQNEPCSAQDKAISSLEHGETDSSEPISRKPVKLTKQDRKQARLEKKIAASRNRKMRHAMETGSNGAPAGAELGQETNPYVVKGQISQIRGEILHHRPQPGTAPDYKILQYHGVALYKSDIDQLCPGEWLNDNNISFMYELIGRELLTKSLHARTPFSKQVVLVFPAVVQLFMHYPDAAAAATFLPAAEIESLRFVFLPVNFGESSGGWTDTGQGDHWLLAVWLVLELRLYCYDSMDVGLDDGENAVLKQLAHRLSQCTAIANNGSPIAVVRSRCCQQQNFDDCGVHVVMNTCVLLARILMHDSLPARVDLDISRVVTSALGARRAMMELVRHVTMNETK